MEFDEKLQTLRKQANLTQEQLAEKLYVSRTAISKWETGNGYPSLESLKDIARLFNTSIDELLSNEKLIELAEENNRSNTKRMLAFIFGILDVVSLSFFLLPLFSVRQGDFIAMNPLIAYGGENYFLFTFSTIIALLIIVGIVELIAVWKKNEGLCDRSTLVSLAIHTVAILAFMMTSEPYATGLLFVLLVAKFALILYQRSKASN